MIHYLIEESNDFNFLFHVFVLYTFISHIAFFSTKVARIDEEYGISELIDTDCISRLDLNSCYYLPC